MGSWCGMLPTIVGQLICATRWKIAIDWEYFQMEFLDRFDRERRKKLSRANVVNLAQDSKSVRNSKFWNMRQNSSWTLVGSIHQMKPFYENYFFEDCVEIFRRGCLFRAQLLCGRQ